MLVEFKEAIIIGFILAFMLGPVFFMLIETSIIKGFRAALSFDLGVILADVIFIIIAYFGSKPLLKNIESNPIYLKIGGLLLIIYGTYYLFNKKTKDIIQDDTLVIQTDYNFFKLILKGFFFNIINIGTLSFWIGIFLVYGTRYQMDFSRLIYFFSAIIATYFCVDLLKILLAKKLREQLSYTHIIMLRKIIAAILIVFGVFLFFNDLLPNKTFKNIENSIENTSAKNLSEK